MRLCIYGAGVIGSIFAGKLALAGNDVTVLARGKRLDALRQNGVTLVDAGTGKTESIPVRVIDQLSPDDRYDYVLIAMQRTQVDAILPVLSKNRSDAFVFIVNTAAGYQSWAEAVGEDRLLLGFPSAGGAYKDGKVCYFIGRGMQRLFQTTTFGSYTGRKTACVNRLISLIRQAGIPSVYCRDMDAWQKTHVAMVTCIANALYGYRCDNVTLGRSYPSVRAMVAAIKEGRGVLRKNGIRPTPAKLWWFALPTPLLSMVFAGFMRTRLAEITMAKHCMAALPEMQCLQQEFDILVERSGLSVPNIDKLKENLRVTESDCPAFHALPQI